MRLQGFAIFAFALALFGSPTLRAQGGSIPAGSSPQTLQLGVVLTGNSDNIKPGEVSLLDNGTPATIQSFQSLQAQNRPTHVILVIDDVDARFSTIAYERSQLKRFFARNEGHLSVPMGLAVMTDLKTEIQPGFSQNGAEENDALQKYQIGLHELRRDSQYGGFERANIGIRALEQLVAYAARVPGRKLIVFISPGWPLLSGPRIELSNKDQQSIFHQVAALQNSMLRADVTLDMVNPFGPGESPLRSDYYESFLKGVRKPSGTDIADLSLQVLAAHSGGAVRQGSSDITGMVQRSIDDLTQAYSLTFSPPPSEATTALHTLQLSVNRPGITARAPDEYYTLSPESTDGGR